MPRQAEADVLVIGAGLVGSAIALRLALEGRDVCLLDSGEPGQGASFGNAGHIATEQVVPLANPEVIRSSWRYLLQSDSPLRLRLAYLLPILPWLARFVWAARPSGLARGIAALMALQRTSMHDLSQLMGAADCGALLHRDGYLRVWEGAAGRSSAMAAALQLGRFGVASEPVDLSTVRRIAPALTQTVQGAVAYPQTGHVDDPLAVTQAFVTALRRAKGRVGREPVAGLVREHDGSATAVLVGGRRIRCRQLVVCAGAWSAPLAASLGYRVPLDTERGYHLTVPWESTGHAGQRATWLTQPIASTERNVIMTPMRMGLRITGTVEFGGLQLPPDARRHALLQRQLTALLPELSSRGATRWMGFRPSLPDHLPVMCEAPRHPGIFFAFGHQHLGLTLSGVTARLMADLMQRRTPDIDMAPYHVGRF